MDEPATVTCGNCCLLLDERQDLDPALRQPCPRCGSTTRTFHKTLTGTLTAIGTAYTQAAIESKARLDQLAQNVEPIEGTGSLTAGAVVVSAETATLIAAIKEQTEATSNAITALIDVVTVGQAQTEASSREAATIANRLKDLTKDLVLWTRVIGVLTIVAVVIALFVAIKG